MQKETKHLTRLPKENGFTWSMHLFYSNIFLILITVLGLVLGFVIILATDLIFTPEIHGLFGFFVVLGVLLGYVLLISLLFVFSWIAAGRFFKKSQRGFFQKSLEVIAIGSLPMFSMAIAGIGIAGISLMLSTPSDVSDRMGAALLLTLLTFAVLYIYQLVFPFSTLTVKKINIRNGTSEIIASDVKQAVKYK